MIRPFHFFLSGILLTAALAVSQEPPKLTLPKLSGVNLGDAPPSHDMTELYATVREAALAAFQGGYEAAVGKHPDRAMRLFLTALRRDQTLSPALYNLAILCAQDGRWADAISFQDEFRLQPDISSASMKLSSAETERVKAIERLERTAEGKRRRAYHIALFKMLPIQDKEPVHGLNEAAGLVALDKNRWEGYAIAGVFQAKLRSYSDSARSFNQASGFAPADRRSALLAAAELAAHEAAFGDQLRSADAFWEKQQYESGAKAYQAAWKEIKARTDSGLLAATGFLMVDQIAPAVEILSEMRRYADKGTTDKVSAMLKQLSEISEEAKMAAGQSVARVEVTQSDSLKSIESLVGSVSNPEMELIVGLPPKLLADHTGIVHFTNDEDLMGGHTENGFLSSNSIFEMYKANLAAKVTTQQAVVIPSEPPASPVVSSIKPSSKNSALEQMVQITSTPANATITFDNQADLKCQTPCEFSLAPGRHTFLATLAGYRDEARVYSAETGKPPPKPVLFVPKMGQLTVESETPGAPIYINGKDRGITPHTFPLPEGSYEIAVGAQGTPKTISLKDGDMVTFKPK